MPDKPKKKPSKWGYCKTDPATHWKKGGPSPNPKGRPKGSKNQKTLWKEAVEKEISVNIDGQPENLTKQEVYYHQLAQKASTGDLKAIGMMLALDEKFDPGETIPPTKEESAADFRTVDEWLKLREKFKVFQKQGDEEDGGG